MRIKLSFHDITAVGFPDRAEHAILGMILAGRVFFVDLGLFVVGEPLCGVGTYS